MTARHRRRRSRGSKITSSPDGQAPRMTSSHPTGRCGQVLGVIPPACPRDARPPPGRQTVGRV